VAAGFEGESVLSNGKSKNVRIGFKDMIFPPSIADSGAHASLMPGSELMNLGV
jgi:hypothetical protein